MDRPEFIVLFRDIAHHPDLTITDGTVFGYIYWMTRLKNEKCYASNETLASLTGLPVSTVRNSLSKLERLCYIRRIFSDANPTEREEIQPLMGFSSIMGAGQPAGGVLTNQQGGAGQPALSIKKSIKEEHLYILEENQKKPRTTLGGFESWWSLYPKKQNKPGASAEWRKLSSEDRAAATVGASRLAESKGIDYQYLPMPGNYLRDRRWEDEEPVKNEPKVHKF